jgi:hypothetical protein
MRHRDIALPIEEIAGKGNGVAGILRYLTMHSSHLENSAVGIHHDAIPDKRRSRADPGSIPEPFR